MARVVSPPIAVTQPSDSPVPELAEEFRPQKKEDVLQAEDKQEGTGRE